MGMDSSNSVYGATNIKQQGSSPEPSAPLVPGAKTTSTSNRSRRRGSHNCTASSTSGEGRFQVETTPADLRGHFHVVALLIVVSPACFNFFSFRICLVLLVGYHLLPSIVRLYYPRFMKDDIISDLRLQPGATLSLFASGTALLLEVHHPAISIAVGTHSEFYNRPLIRLLRTFLFVEMLFNGTSEEKEQTASWLRWTHRNIYGPIPENIQSEEPDISAHIKSYGYSDDLKAWVMYSLTYATIAFQMRYGRPLSERAKDTIVLENTCAALRLGISEHLLARDYNSFMLMFNQRLDSLDSHYSITGNIVNEVEKAALTAEASWTASFLLRLGLMIGYDLLPERVRNQYQLMVLRNWWQRAIQRAVVAFLWFAYPALIWLPLRGVICLLLVLEPRLRSAFKASLQTIHSMDIMHDRPALNTENQNPASILHLPSYLQWLDAGKDGRPFLQVVLVCILEAQLVSEQASKVSNWPILTWIFAWIKLPVNLAWVTIDSLHRSTQEIISVWKAQIKESSIFKGNNVKVPKHVGFVMDGNRRFARNLGKPVLFGHQLGAQTAGNILEWWLKSTPRIEIHTQGRTGLKYLTVWAFSSENLKRSQEEVDGLFRLMSAEFKSLAYTSIVHLFRIRIRVIGNITGYPIELIESIKLLEKSTSMYDNLYLQIAVGYGGRDEIVQSVMKLLAKGQAVNESTIAQHTYCAEVGVPSVELIVRTSERRTSGFFLWDTQAAELYFIDKLWPQLTENDWLDAVYSFSRREMRGGK